MHAAATAKDERSVSINIRAPRPQRDLIDRAAQVLRKTRTEFMLESACQAAEEALLDQRVFFLDDDQHKQFLERLDTVGPDIKKLAALLNRKAPWEA
ncbi:MAG TPA: DUF1778 domain-containing protein [Azospirillaceae bacterium]|nr:DUF1778 domain-containing protein [Azospirillaceae bacterium]